MRFLRLIVVFAAVQSVPCLLHAETEFRSYFAHVGDGQGLTTAIVVVNPRNSSVTGSLRFFTSSGLSMSVTIGNTRTAKFDFAVAAKSSVRLQTQGDSNPVQSGWALLTSSAPLEGVALFQFWSQTRLITEAGVSRSVPVKAAQLYCTSLGDVSTGVGIANVSAQLMKVAFTLTSLNGSLVATAERELGASQHSALFINELFPDVSSIDEFEGVLKVQAPGEFVATVVRFQSSPGLVVSTLPVVAVSNDVGETKGNGTIDITLENARVTGEKPSKAEIEQFMQASLGGGSWPDLTGRKAVLVRFSIRASASASGAPYTGSDFQIRDEQGQIYETSIGLADYLKGQWQTTSFVFFVPVGTRGYLFRYHHAGLGEALVFDLSNLE